MNSAEFDATDFVKRLTRRPGVYRMLDSSGKILYIGKAKNLKNRVGSYFRSGALDSKTLALVKKIAEVEITVTASETEALLLEQSLIKECSPPYNIVFRDDKSYPYIFLSENEDYPRLAFHRGAPKQKGSYFGPYPSSYAVRESLHTMQKIFRVRQCEDAFFRNRSRPCLQYQIKRCSGPCCSLIKPDDYAKDVANVRLFLEGRNTQVIDDYANRMELASEALEFEKAALYRDQISHLRKVQEQQYVIGGTGNTDIIAVLCKPVGACLSLLVIRNGRLLGSKPFFPKMGILETEANVLEAFIFQHYLSAIKGQNIPDEIVVNVGLENSHFLEQKISELSGNKIKISSKVRGQKSRWVALALTNAEQSLDMLITERQTMRKRFEALTSSLNLEAIPERMECFDISHTGGESTVASCVVFDQKGPLKSDYRRFNIEGITAGDDYGAIHQAITRRYSRLKKSEGLFPDLLIIDGGKGQLNQAVKVLEELQVEGVTLLAVAKGEGRKPGLETLYKADGSEFHLSHSDPGLNLIQHIRDESHRFALTAHRQRRGKKRNESLLERIEGVGPRRRRSLLRHFGAVQQIAGASVEELAKVEGISQKLATEIYESFHNR